MGENTHQNCTRQNKNKEDPGRQQPCWGFLFCTKLTQPTGALNRTASNEVMEELVKLNEEGTTIMMVTHDAKGAAKCSRVLYIVDGNIKGEYISPRDLEIKEKDRERMLNNWLLELGW